MMKLITTVFAGFGVLAIAKSYKAKKATKLGPVVTTQSPGFPQ